MENDEKPTHKTQNRLSISLNLKWVCIVLLIIIIVMLFLWRPWTSKPNSGRTISVTGETVLKAEPDEYVFTPRYEFKSTSGPKAIAELTKKSEEIVAGLKKLGVANKDIKTNADGYNSFSYEGGSDDQKTVYSLNLSVITTSKSLADKIQNYLISTSPLGVITPQANFSTAKRKALESTARAEAAQDARQKALQLADKTDFKLGKVQSVSEGNGFNGGPMPYGVTETLDVSNPNNASKSAAPAQKLSLQPGENELTFTVTVTYYIK